MKTHLFIVWSLVFLAACSATQIIRKKSNDAKVQEQLEMLFTACQNQDYATAAASIVYRGNDEARRWKDVSNYEAEEEKNSVDGICKEIRDLLAGSDSYDWGEYLEEEESEGVWHVQAVRFEKGVQRQERHFAFLMIGEVFALGDID